MRIKLFTIGLFLIAIALVSCGQSRQEKTISVIHKLKLIEDQKQSYKFQLEPLKYQATGNDSIRIVELEKKLSDDEMIKKISSAFDEVFTEDELNDIYNFIQTSAFDKFFNSGKVYAIIASKFKDIDQEIKKITNNFNESVNRQIAESPITKFKPIPIDKEDGFYATVGYTFSTADEDIKLEEKPSLTSSDILKIRKGL